MKFKSRMRSLGVRTTIILFLSILLCVLCIAYIARGGYYPIALAHGSWISARDFWTDYDASLTYFKETGTVSRLSGSFDPEFRTEIARSSLDRLIEHALVRRGLDDMVGKKQAEQLVDMELKQQNLDDEVLAEATSKLYGISAKKFIALVAVPQARQDVLIKELEKQEKNFETWKTEVKTAARISVFSSMFEWDGDSIVAKSKPAN